MDPVPLTVPLPDPLPLPVPLGVAPVLSEGVAVLLGVSSPLGVLL